MRVQLVAIALIVGALALTSGQQSQPPPPRPLGPGPESGVISRGTGMIAGRVVEAGSTTPVTDAIVTLNGPSNAAGPGMAATPTSSQQRRAATTGDGRFLFRDLPKGTYYFSVSATGYVPGSLSQSKPVQVARPLDPSRGFDLEDGELATGLSLSIWKQGGVSGTVVDESGEPLIGVVVSVMSRVVDWSGPIMQPAATTITDDRGRYHVDLTPGDYIVAVMMSTTTVPVSAIDLYLQASAEGPASAAGQAITGLRFGQTPFSPGVAGTRFGGFHVSWQNAFAGMSPTFGADGQVSMYSTTFYPQAPTATTASVVSIGSGEEKAGLNLQLRPVIARRVSGRVLGPSGPVAHVGVRLVVPDPADDRRSGASMFEGVSGMTDAGGRFTVFGVPPGRYLVRVMRMPENSRALFAAEVLNVGDDNVDDVAITVTNGAVFSGRVVYTGSAPVPTPPPRLIITARPVPGSKGSMMWTGVAVGPDPSGRFSSVEFMPGPYVFTVAGVPNGWTVKSVMAGTIDALDLPVELPIDGLRDIVVTLVDRVTTLTGTARDADGRPASGAWIAAFPVDKNLWRRAGLASRRTQVVLPGRAGQYSVKGLPAGEYFVVATTGASLDFSDPKILSSLIPDASRVVLQDGDSKSLDLRAIVRR